jgi:hypothetical protein
VATRLCTNIDHGKAKDIGLEIVNIQIGIRTDIPVDIHRPIYLLPKRWIVRFDHGPDMAGVCCLTTQNVFFLIVIVYPFFQCTILEAESVMLED